MDLPPGTDDLVKAVLEVQPNAMIVVLSATLVTMPWADQAKALLQAWYGGSRGGNGIVDVLFGDVNPSAKLTLTFPHDNAHNPLYLSYRSEGGRVLYSEDVYVGYRYYDMVRQAPLFLFGHGLSYTPFQISGLSVEETAPQAPDIRESSISARVWVTNTGSRAGAEVVQVFVRPPTSASVGRPVCELKEYEKTMLRPAEAKEISVTVPVGLPTSFWDEGHSAWLGEKRIYAIEVAGTGERNFLSEPLYVQVSQYWNGL